MNNYYEYSTVGIVDKVISNFMQSYNQLVSMGGNNYVLEAAVRSYVDNIYKEKIASICHLSPSMINDEIFLYIKRGKEFERTVEGGRLVRVRAPFNDDEVCSIVQNYYGAYSKNYNVPIEPVNNERVAHKKEEIPVETPVEKPVDNHEFEELPDYTGYKLPDSLELTSEDFADGLKDKKEEVKEDNGSLVIPSEELVLPLDLKDGLIKFVDLKSQELIKKYVNTKYDDSIQDSIMSMYKQALSKITGIKAEDIKDFVCNRIQAGITDNVKDENGESKLEKRSLTDEEAKLITVNINDLTEEEVEKLISG